MVVSKRWTKKFMLQELHAPAVPPSRWKPDENYDSKPVDLEYFKKYVTNQEELKTPYKCLPTADTPFQANQIYQNTIKPKFVSGSDAIDTKRQTFSLMNLFNENVFLLNPPPVPKKSNRQPLPKNYFKNMPP
jgi:hypothetical protein